MMKKEYSMIKNIRESPKAIENTLSHINDIEKIVSTISRKNLKRIFFVGCGTSYFISMNGIYPLIGCPRLWTYSVPSSEMIHYFNRLVDENSVVIGISRSGKTAETVTAIEQSKKKGAFTVCFTSTSKNRLSKISDESIVFDIGEEKSIIMTKSFTSLSLATLLTAFLLSKKNQSLNRVFESELGILPSYAREILNQEGEIERIAKDKVREGIERFVYLGSGPAYPIAMEGAMKVKETSYVASEGLHTLEFRHGPMSSIGEKMMFMVIVLKGSSETASVRFVSDIKQIGADVVSVTNLKENLGSSIRVPLTQVEEFSALLSIIPMQIFGYYYSVSKKLNPDQPRHLFRFVARF